MSPGRSLMLVERVPESAEVCVLSVSVPDGNETVSVELVVIRGTWRTTSLSSRTQVHVDSDLTRGRQRASPSCRRVPDVT